MKFYFAQVDADLGILWPSVHPDQHAALRDASSLPQVPDYSKYFEYPRCRYSKLLPWELAFYITHNCMSRINIGQCIRAEHAFVMALRHCATICTVYLGAKCDKKLRNGRNVATAFLYCPSLHKSYMIFLRQMLFLYGVNSHNCLYFTFAPPRQTRAQSPSSAEIS